jgi:dihydrofolate reductase
VAPLSLIFAIAENGVIGRGGKLPWDFPEDRAFFFRTTRGHAVIMGRRTWEERGEPLEGRTNIVVSKTLSLPAGVAATVVPTLTEAIELARKTDPDPFVLGGVGIFEEAMPLATRLYVTEIKGSYEGDTFFHFDRTGFRVVSERVSPPSLRFLVLERAS